jgi:hypothetical protein
MAGKLGIVSVNVDSLDNADECDEQDAQQRQSRGGCAFARFVFRGNQTQRPISISVADTPQVSPMMHRGGSQVAQSERSESKEFAQTLGLGAADRYFSLFLVVQAQLIRALEPGNDFLDPVNIHQERAVGAPE